MIVIILYIHLHSQDEFIILRSVVAECGVYSMWSLYADKSKRMVYIDFAEVFLKSV